MSGDLLGDEARRAAETLLRSDDAFDKIAGLLAERDAAAVELADLRWLARGSRLTLDNIAEGREGATEAAAQAQRIVDHIGHRVTDEPPHTLVENDRLRAERDAAVARVSALEAGLLVHADADGVMTLEWVEGATTAVVAREVLEELVRARNLAVTELGWKRLAAPSTPPAAAAANQDDGPTELEVVTAERDAARAQIAVLDRLVCRCAPLTPPAAETLTTCPTCGWVDHPFHTDAELDDFDCDDPWHTPETGADQ